MKQVFTFVLCVLMIQAILCADAYALQSTSQQLPRRAISVGKLVKKLGFGRDALVAVRLRDKSVASGYIAEAGPESFTIADLHDNQSRSIPYEQVDRLAGYSFVTGTQVQHGGGIRGKLARVAGYVMPGKRVFRNNLSGGTKVLLIGIIVGVLIAIVVAKTV